MRSFRTNWSLLSFGLFLSTVLCFDTTGNSIAPDHMEQRCEKITIPMCMDIGYNFTSMPNLLDMESQEEAGLEVHQFWPLVEINCSEDLKFFLCSMYAPICIEEYLGHIPSCQSVCERAREGCTPIMIQYGFNWPDKMNCSELPKYGDGFRICMDPKKGANLDTENQSPKTIHTETTARNENEYQSKQSSSHHHDGRMKSKTSINNSNNNGHKNHQHHQQNGKNQQTSSVTTSIIADKNGQIEKDIDSSVDNCRCDCRSPYFIRLRNSEQSMSSMSSAAGLYGPQHLHHHHYQHSSQQQQHSLHYFNYSRIETAGGLAPHCAISCKGPYRFHESERETAFFWIGITALICAITCLLTVFTSLTDTQRFRYPERAIIFLAGCYVFIAGGYLLRIRLGPQAIACDGPFIRYQKTGPIPASCILSFILLYFFGMASAYWWLILTLTWFLAAGLKWSSEAITSYAQYFHLFAWILPTIQSIAILCLGAIDGDSFLGVCSVGNQSRANLLIFVITPLCVCITVGITLLFTGFVALFRIRRAIQQIQYTIRVKTEKLEKLMIRIGLSSFLYIVPEVVVVACHIYDYINRPQWEKSLACICDHNDPREHHQPQFSLIVLKYIMSLIIGITSSFWIWSGKTLESWLKIYTRISCCTNGINSPSSSRSGASQLLPNMAGYYGRSVPLTSVLNTSPPIKTQTVNLGQINPLSHHLHPNHHHLQQQKQRNGGSMILPPPPSIPPPPPPMMINNNHHTGSLTSSQFTHMIGSINGASLTNGTNHLKHPLSHV
ncbi:frizzled-2-like protein [Sarcoptes scabiei]|uniref:Frizzled-2-like protein n=2 Tax=Sarcoptes scabiei TaxID=52283 RepID=A0A132A7K3_SARSC|nr:frizzled-2-like protein [Sarcoptes scabiei]